MRRLWLALLLAGLCSTAAAQLRLLVQSSPLAGFQFHAGPAVWSQLKVGDALTLVREPGNKHDGNAIRVEWQGQMLGYLPRVENHELAASMDRGIAARAQISALRNSKDPWQRILVDVYIPL